MSIYWEKYIDPLSNFIDPNDIKEVYDGYGADKEEWREHEERPKVYSGPMAMTSMGLIGLNKDGLLQSKLDMWVCRTDFDITPVQIQQVELVPGVEILKPLTRYSFLMGSGPQFDSIKVRKAVSQTLEPPYDRVGIMASAAARTFKHWAIISNNMKKMSCISGTSLVELNKKLRSIEEGWSVKARG